MKRALGLLVVALVFVPVGQGAQSRHQTGLAKLPTHGVLHLGNDLAGVKIGDSDTKVKQLWGTNYKVCPNCKSPTWYFLYQTGEPLGAAVKFKNHKVVAVFTLGSPLGWRTAEGLLVGDQVEKASALYGTLGWHGCIGYGAMSKRSGNTVTSIYTTGEAVYGFAITALAEPVCQ